MTDADDCQHCPDGHDDPDRKPWAVWVTETRVDGQPPYLHAAPSNGAHVAESDAEWLRQAIKEHKGRHTVTEELRQRPEDQPLPVQGREDVQTQLIKAVRERRDLGIRRYGSPLMTHNGRDALKDAWEESLDLAAYLTQLRMECDDAAGAVARLAAWLNLHEGERDAYLINQALSLLAPPS